jgi:HPt (histidine-containing phosphotransfer) domain-containing protein
MMRIRAREVEHQPGRRLPIVAVTANAIPRDIERCIACGADDVLTKPVMLAGLEGILVDWLSHEAKPDRANTQQATRPQGGTQATVMDRRNLEELRENASAEGFAAFIANFDTYQAQLLEDIRRQLASRDAEAIARALHTFKGGAAYVGAVELPLLCKTLEGLAHDGQIDALAARMADLEASHARLSDAVAAFAAESQAGTGRNSGIAA